ncbi:MAG TPA: TetR/AcrR family transcriptional regulator [Polyangiaceae bacterium]
MPPRRAAVRVEPPRARFEVEERRRQLVALGTELFSQRTYDDVSIDELAQEAGISKGLLYHYFPSKRHLYVETVREAARQLLERTATPENMDPLERLRAGLDAYVEYVGKHGRPYQTLLRSGVGADAEVTKIVDATRDAFCARLVEAAPGAAHGPLVQMALRGWVGFVESATLEWLDQKKKVDRAQLRNLLMKVLLEAMSAASG